MSLKSEEKLAKELGIAVPAAAAPAAAFVQVSADGIPPPL